MKKYLIFCLLLSLFNHNNTLAVSSDQDTNVLFNRFSVSLSTCYHYNPENKEFISLLKTSAKMFYCFPSVELEYWFTSKLSLRSRVQFTSYYDVHSTFWMPTRYIRRKFRYLELGGQVRFFNNNRIRCDGALGIAGREYASFYVSSHIEERENVSLHFGFVSGIKTTFKPNIQRGLYVGFNAYHYQFKERSTTNVGFSIGYEFFKK